MLLIQRLPEIVAFTVLVLTSIIGAWAPMFVVLELGLFALLIVVRRREFLTTVLRWWPLLIVPALCAASAIWSNAPGVSLRYGAQLFITALLAVFLARLMTPRRFLLVLFAATLVFCLLSLALGREGPSAEGMVPIGLTGSKNQFAYFGQLMLATSLALIVLKGAPSQLRAAAFLGLPIATYILFVTNSATAVLTAIGGGVIFLIFVFMQRMSRVGRLSAIIAAVIVLSPLAFLTTEAIDVVQTFQTQVLQKDATLTGRTFLWERAEDLIAQEPMTGHGYRAAWMGETTVTRGLLDWAGITSGRGFHFHNNYLELAVDIGILGSAFFALTIAAALLAAARQFYMTPSVATSFFFTMLLILTLRTFTDLIYSPLSIHTILLVVCSSYAFWQGKPEVAQNSATPIARRQAYA